MENTYYELELKDTGSLIIQKDLSLLPLSTYNTPFTKVFYSDCFYHTKENLYSFFVSIHKKMQFEVQEFNFIIVFLPSFPYSHPFVYSLNPNTNIQIDNLGFLIMKSLSNEFWNPTISISLILYFIELIVASMECNVDTEMINQIEIISEFKQKQVIYEFIKAIKPMFNLVRLSKYPKIMLFDNYFLDPCIITYDTKYILSSVDNISYFKLRKLAGFEEEEVEQDDSHYKSKRRLYNEIDDNFKKLIIH